MVVEGKLDSIIVIGVDLSGTERAPTGWASLEDRRIITRVARTNDEIIDWTARARPALVGIDGPLTLPSRGAVRSVDIEMHRRGYPVLPPLFPGMKDLTYRAIHIAKEMTRLGLTVIEVHPESTRKALGLPRGLKQLMGAFREMGFRGEFGDRAVTVHEKDAMLAALTAYLHLLGKTEVIGDEGGRIVLPRPIPWREVLL